MRIPKHASDLDLAWVNLNLGTHVRSTPESVVCARVGAAFGLAGVTYRLVVCHAKGTDVFAIKVCTPEAADHEAWVYRNVLPRTRVSAPEFVDVLQGETHGILVTRFVDGARQGDVLTGCTQAQSLALAQMLADLHAPWWQVAADGVPESLQYEPPRAEHPDSAVLSRCAERHGSWISGGADALLSHLGDVPSAVATLASQPMTVAHRDYHLDNVLFSDAGPVVLDWEGACRAPAAVDVARLMVECHLLGQRLERDAIVRRIYLDRLAEHDVALDADTLDEGIVAAQRVLLGGAVRWAGAERAVAAGSREESLQRNLLRNLTTSETS